MSNIAIFDKKTSYLDALKGNGYFNLDTLTVSAETSENIYGDYELQITLALEGDAPIALYEMIEVDNIIKVKDEGGDELFRIATVDKGLDAIDIYARHITIADSLNLWLDNVKPTNLNGAQALQWMAQRTKPTCKLLFSSDIGKTNTADYVRKNLYEAITDGENSFLSRWGGEISRRGITTYINRQLGQDKSQSIIIKEALNLTEFTMRTNIDEISTVIYPIAFNGITSERVESPLLNNYSMEFPIEIKYEDVKLQETNEQGEITQEGLPTEEEVRAELIRRANLEFSENNIDKLRIECDVNYVDLARYEEFKEIPQLQRTDLGDIVSVFVDTFNLALKARVVSRKYDVLMGKRIENTLSTDGKLKTPTKIDDIIKDLIDKVEGGDENIKDLSGYIDSMMQAGMSDSYVVLMKNVLLAMDNKDKNLAKKVVAINKNGIGFSQTGISGPYKYGFTIDGKINADLITMGAMSGQYIKGGTIEANHLTVNAKETLREGLVTTQKFAELTADVNGLSSKVGKVDSNVGEVQSAFEGFKNQTNSKFGMLLKHQADFENYINGAFKDGIIDESEAKIIHERLNAMNIEMQKLEAEYNQVYNSPILKGDVLLFDITQDFNALKKAKEELENSILEAIKDEKISPLENEDVIKKTNTFKSRLQFYKQTFIKAIDAMGKRYSAQALKDAKSFAQSEIKQTADKIETNVVKIANDTSAITNEFNNYKKQAEGRFDAIENLQNDFESELNGAFADGIIDEAEMKIIEERLYTLDMEMHRINSDYMQLYGASVIQGTHAQTQLTKFKNDLEVKYVALTNKLRDIIKDKKVTEEEKKSLGVATQTFKNFLEAYEQAYIIALNEVGRLYSQQALNDSKTYTSSQISQTASSIRTEVKQVRDIANVAKNKANAVETKQSSLKQDVDGFKFSINQTINKANLVPHGILRGCDNYHGWDIDGSCNWWNSGDWRGFRPNYNGSTEHFMWSKPINVQVLRNRVVSLCARILAEANTRGADVFLIGSTNDTLQYDWAHHCASFAPSSGGITISSSHNITIPKNIKYVWVRIDHNGRRADSNNMVYVDWVNLTEGESAFEAHGLQSNSIAEGVTTINRDGIRCDFNDGSYAEMGKNGFAYKKSGWSHPYQYITKILKVSMKQNGHWHTFNLGNEFKGKQLDRDFTLNHHIGAVNCNKFVNTGQYGGALRASFTEIRNWNPTYATVEARVCIQKITLKSEVMFGWDNATTDTHRGGIVGESAGDIILIAQM